MRQLTLATVGFDRHSKQTRRAKFLAEMANRRHHSKTSYRG
jgi:hypothetical protein